MEIPKYVWKCGIILLFIGEIRKCVELYLTFYKNDDEMEEEIPDAVKHLYT